MIPAYDDVGRLVGYDVVLPLRPAGAWDLNRPPPIVGDRVGTGTVHAIAAHPGVGHRIFVRGDDGAITETTLVEFARSVASARLLTRRIS